MFPDDFATSRTYNEFMSVLLSSSGSVRKPLFSSSHGCFQAATRGPFSVSQRPPFSVSKNHPVFGLPKSSRFGLPKSSVFGLPESSFFDLHNSSIFGLPKSSLCRSPRSSLSGSPKNPFCLRSSIEVQSSRVKAHGLKLQGEGPRPSARGQMLKTHKHGREAER